MRALLSFFILISLLTAAEVAVSGQGFSDERESSLLTRDASRRAAVVDAERQLVLAKGCRLDVSSGKPVLTASGSSAAQAKMKAVYLSDNWCFVNCKVQIASNLSPEVLSFKYKFKPKADAENADALSELKKQTDSYILNVLAQKLQKTNPASSWVFSLYAVEMKADKSGVKGSIRYILKNPSSR